MLTIYSCKIDFSKIKSQQYGILNRIFVFLIFLFLGLMSASVTHAETYTLDTEWSYNGWNYTNDLGPTDVAVDPSNYIYVIDSASRILKFDSIGRHPSVFGHYGTGIADEDPYHRDLCSLAVDSSGNIYAGSSKNHSIAKFDVKNGSINEWNSYNDSNSPLNNNLVDIAVDSHGNVYVADPINNRIQKFDSNGRLSN
jgi:sugar lactone lactonase YvrE